MKHIALLIALPVFLAGCLSVNTGTPIVDGGIYRSPDRAQTFEHITNILSVGGGQSFGGENTVFLQFDPSDLNTLYYSTHESGLYVSHDSGSSWRSIFKDHGTVFQMAINPENPCHLYALTNQNIFESVDCGRIWDAVYLEKVPGRIVRSIIIDSDEPYRIFAGLSDGTFLLSEDSGATWKVWQRFEVAIDKIWANPKNTDIMYLISPAGFFRSDDQGANWEYLSEIIRDDHGFAQADEVQQLHFIPEVEDGFFTVSPYGIVKTLDGGQTWEAPTLLPRPAQQSVLNMAANPANMNELYYSTQNGIFYSVDGGVNWETLNTPSGRWPVHLLVHPADSRVLYVAMYVPAA